jgi:hypothetical protein
VFGTRKDTGKNGAGCFSLSEKFVFKKHDILRKEI